MSLFRKLLETYHEVCNLQLEILGNDCVSSQKSQQLHDNLINLNSKVVWTRKQYLNECRAAIASMTMPEYLQMLDSIEQKITNLKTALKQINPGTSFNLKPNSKSDQMEQRAVLDKWDSCTKKQKLYINLIESLEANENVCATESQIRYKHLTFLYNSFISNQIETVNNSSDTDFDSQLKLSTQIQQKVISLQTKLKKIIDSNTSQSSNLELDAIKSLKRPNDDSQSKNSDTSENLSSHGKKQRDIIEKIKNLHLSNSDLNDQSNQFQQDQIPQKSSEEINLAKPESQLFTPDIKQTESDGTNINGQSNQIEPEETSKDPSSYYEKQNKIVEKIEKLQFVDFTSSPDLVLEMCSELVINLCESFTSNHNEIVVKLIDDGHCLHNQECLAQAVSEQLLQIQKAIAISSKNKKIRDFTGFIEESDLDRLKIQSDSGRKTPVSVPRKRSIIAQYDFDVILEDAINTRF